MSPQPPSDAHIQFPSKDHRAGLFMAQDPVKWQKKLKNKPPTKIRHQELPNPSCTALCDFYEEINAKFKEERLAHVRGWGLKFCMCKDPSSILDNPGSLSTGRMWP